MNNVAQCLARAAHPQCALYLPSTAAAAAAENGGLKSEELGPTRAVRHLMDATAGRGGTIESVHRLCRRTQSGSVNIWTKRSHGRLKAPVVHAHVFETSLKARCKRVFSHTNNGTAAFNELANMASGPNSAPALGWPPLNGAETNDTWVLFPNVV